MLQKYLIRNIQVVNEGRIETKDVLLQNGRIERVADHIETGNGAVTEIDGEGKYLLPGAIDDQVHFREPGLTHKATIYTEAKAAVAGGVTSFMEMPNTQPPVFTQQLLEDKYALGAQHALANYSFFMGTSNDNVEEVLRTNEKKDSVCGVKIFMGASTGNLLVDNYLTMGRIFSESELLIATHCEEESIIKENYARLKAEKGTLSPADHPLIRNEEACFESSLKAIQLAMKHNTRLHILHISTERELQLFTNMMPAGEKRITSEVCVHHLHFTSDDYAKHGYDIKCNPAIKAPHNREALWQALLDDRLDVIATDHAPHLRSEKEGDYEHAHAGLPLVQHPLLLMLHYHKQGRISLEKIAQKMSHAVADCFRIRERGYIREGYWADLVIVDLGGNTEVTGESLYYKCGWSPLEGFVFPARITHTFVNGHAVYANGVWDESHRGQRLRFDR
jgi:dihydroorotase